MRSSIEATYSDFATFRRAIVIVGGSTAVGLALGVHWVVAKWFSAFIASQGAAVVSSEGSPLDGLRTRSSGADKMGKTLKSQVACWATDAWDKSSRVGEQAWRLGVARGAAAKRGHCRKEANAVRKLNRIALCKQGYFAAVTAVGATRLPA
jgi:hypothetical protein